MSARAAKVDYSEMPSVADNSFGSGSESEGSSEPQLGPKRGMHFEDDEHIGWHFKETLSYIVTCFTVEGSILFTVGSLMCYPGLLPEGEELEWVERAWIDYPFMIGGWFFTVGNYFLYFQVINKDHDHDNKKSVRVVKIPSCSHKGEIASILNVVGALFYNIGTMTMFGYPPKDTDTRYDIWYVGTGVAGSLCFAIAGFIQGQYNDFCHLRAEPEVVSSWMNFTGAIGFLVGYALCYEHFGWYSQHPWVNIWLVTTPFFVGSLLFGVAAYMELYMWKTEHFGLGFAADLQKSTREEREKKMEEEGKKVTWTQMLLVMVYFLNLCICWIRFGFKASRPDYEFKGLVFGMFEKIFTYHAVLLLVSVLHKIPDQHPYDYLVWFMRLIALWGLCTECIELYEIVHGYSTGEKMHML